MFETIPIHLTRRAVLAAAALTPLAAHGATPAGSRLHFTIFRDGVRVGEHQMSFARTPGWLEVVTEVAMIIRLGPIPVVRYSHRARESWRGDAFESLQTTTSTNGKREQVSATVTEGRVRAETADGVKAMAAGARPLTHWNPEVFGGPLFNPQTGRMLKVSPQRTGESGGGFRWTVHGEAEIEDRYDEAGVWTSLRGRLPDRSTLEYRRS